MSYTFSRGSAVLFSSHVSLGFLLVLPKCVGPTEAGTGGAPSGSASHSAESSSATYIPPHPQCYFADDCPDASCVEEVCVPHPAGWCVLTSACPLPEDGSCASAYCDAQTSQCMIYNYPAGGPCGSPGEGGVGGDLCDGSGHCVHRDAD